MAGCERRYVRTLNDCLCGSFGSWNHVSSRHRCALRHRIAPTDRHASLPCFGYFTIDCITHFTIDCIMHKVLRAGSVSPASRTTCLRLVGAETRCARGYAGSRQAIIVQALRNTRFARGLRMDAKVAPLTQALISLSRRDLAALMPFGAYVEAASDAFRLHAQGRTVLPPPMHFVTESGGFHVKAGGLPSGPGYVAFKVNANFPNNRATNGLPTIP